MNVIEVEVLQGDDVAHRVAVGPRPLSLGRGPSNDLVLSEVTVSWHHATLWQDGGTVFLRDLGSTNGTWLGEERVIGAVALADGARVRVGLATMLRVRHLDTMSLGLPRAFAVEEAASGVRFPLLSDRWVIGSSANAQVRVDGPEQAATLLVHSDEVWLGIGGEDRPLAAGESFEVAGRTFQLVEVEAHHVPTASLNFDRYPYRLEAALDGPTGSVASLADPLGHCLNVEGNRAILLYLLARALHEDRLQGRPADEAGWRPDVAVRTGVWGKTGDDNKLHVLLHRLRGEIERAGLDPWCVEKKRRYVRIRAADVVVREARPG